MAVMNKKRIGFKIYFAIFIFIILILAISFYLIEFNKKNPTINPVVLQPMYYSSLNGMPVSSTEKMKSSVVGIMIDNHNDARPQSGLLAAKIVYEAPAEGGITRYFAIYDSEQNIDKIGPVRSARPYFIDWIEEYDGLYMHCGGSPEALERLKKGPVFDLNEMTNGDYYWRDTNKIAPHNLYTNSEKWNKILTKRESSKKFFNNGWLFGEISTTSTEQVKNISIDYTLDYAVGWTYDGNQKNYHRLINGVAMNEEGINLLADSIVIQYVKSVVVDDYGRKEITTSGQGDMRLLRDGIMIRGVWKKDNGRTRFYDNAGQEQKLKPGKIWIQIVPKDINIKIST